jgi:hypothetical protein
MITDNAILTDARSRSARSAEHLGQFCHGTTLIAEALGGGG